jgi:hypothetical protein
MELSKRKPCATQQPITPAWVGRCSDCANYMGTTERDEIAVVRWLWENPTAHECIIRKFQYQSDQKSRYLKLDYVFGNRLLIFAWQCMATSKAGYAIYRQSDHWQFVRRWMVDLYGATCELCGSTKYINVHHRCYEHIGHERIGCLTSLCEGCHKHFHFGDPAAGLGGRSVSSK